MRVAATLSEAQIESLSKVLGDCATGSEITQVLASLGLDDGSEGETKWRRLNDVFSRSQAQELSASRILDYIHRTLEPVRYVGKNEEFEIRREQINEILAFSGLAFGSDGEFEEITTATTLTEARQRASTIRAKFDGRRIHPEVLKYCRAELMQDNSFHAVLEATKGLMQRIREMSGVEGDGAPLVDRVFSTSQPVLRFNELQTETQKSEHTGIATLLKGCITALRNPRAHQPRILWKDDDDTTDYLTLISFLHRKLDDCKPTGTRGPK